MSILNVPTGQLAYQAIVMKQYAQAWTPYVRTVNRYMAGYTGLIQNGPITGVIDVMPQMAQRCGRRLSSVPVGGAASQVTSTGGAGYVLNEVVTMAPINGGRSVVVKVIGVSGGAPNNWQVIDPGSGMTAGGTGVSNLTSQTAALTQLSTTGVGTGASWIAAVGIGWGNGPLPRPDA